MSTEDGHTRASRRLAAILAADIAGYSVLIWRASCSIGGAKFSPRASMQRPSAPASGISLLVSECFSWSDMLESARRYGWKRR